MVVSSSRARFAADDPREVLRRLHLDGVIEGVSLVAADATACGTCSTVTDRMYVPWELPGLPIDGCSRAGGCRCRYEPNVTVVE